MNRSMSRRAIGLFGALIFALGGAACASSSGGSDASADAAVVVEDAGSEPDLGSAPDLGEPPDAGAPPEDAGEVVVDAGVDPDLGVADAGTQTYVDSNGLTLHQGFKLERYSSVVGARQMAVGADGTVYVGSLNGWVYAIRDADGDGTTAEEVIQIADGLNRPNGVAVRDGDLYVAEVGRILVYRDIASQLPTIPTPEVLTDVYPEDRHHGHKYIAFGPDGMLYVPVGAPCNICDTTEGAIYGNLTRIRADGTGLETVAEGIRNTVGFDWHPTSGDLWFTDNNRDNLGDDLPPGELNHVSATGQHFGYPWCHGTSIVESSLSETRGCAGYRPPALELQAHVAALGMKFYRGTMFPERYRGAVIVAEHGSWNRSRKVGYRVMIGTLEGSQVVAYEPFITGWLNEDTQRASARPVDMVELADGSLLISDDAGGRIFRLSYDP